MGTAPIINLPLLAAHVVFTNITIGFISIIQTKIEIQQRNPSLTHCWSRLVHIADIFPCHPQLRFTWPFFGYSACFRIILVVLLMVSIIRDVTIQGRHGPTFVSCASVFSVQKLTTLPYFISLTLVQNRKSEL